MMDLAGIQIALSIEEDGHKIVRVDWTEDAELVELLGMLKMAEDTILRAKEEDDE
jgi:hypothetical protein